MRAGTAAEMASRMHEKLLKLCWPSGPPDPDGERGDRAPHAATRSQNLTNSSPSLPHPARDNQRRVCRAVLA
jgi:hypothetical protein